MDTKKVRLSILLLLIGFLLLAIDIHVPTGINYPKQYDNNKDVIGEFQFYAINTFYGATCTYKEIVPDNPTTPESGSIVIDPVFIDDVFFKSFRIDIFNDVVALILIAISAFIMRKQHITFMASFIFSFVAIIIKFMLSGLPLFVNGMALCDSALILGITYLSSFNVVTYFMYRGYIRLMQDSCCRDERLWLSTTWFVSLVLFVLILFTTWLDLTFLAIFFTVALVLDILVFVNTLKRTFEFICRNTKA